MSVLDARVPEYDFDEVIAFTRKRLLNQCVFFTET